MIAILCRDCSKGIAITPGEDGEVEALFVEDGHVPEGLACPSCSSKSLYKTEANLTADAEIHELTATEAFAAFGGLGLPADQDCGAMAVAQALMASPVRLVTARPIRGSHRSIIELIELQDGTKLFFGASVHGAIVYRISRPSSYAQEALRGS